MTRLCPLCGIFQKNGWVIENLEKEARSVEFPASFVRLLPVPSSRDSGNEKCSLQCPECGLMYEYRRTTPGGSLDAMYTWVVETLKPMMKHGRHHRKDIPQLIPVKNKDELRDCEICGIFGDGWETSHPTADGYDDSFPDNLNRLIIVKRHEGVSPHTLYQCPSCSRYYYQHATQEWDNFNEVMVDIEKLYPVGDEEALTIINPEPRESRPVEINITGRCSKCNSKNIERVRETRVEKDILVWCKCLDCGNEEFMDAYEEFGDDYR